MAVGAGLAALMPVKEAAAAAAQGCLVLVAMQRLAAPLVVQKVGSAARLDRAAITAQAAAVTETMRKMNAAAVLGLVLRRVDRQKAEMR